MSGLRVIRWDVEHTLTVADQELTRWAGQERYRLNRAVEAQYDDYHRRDVLEQEYDAIGASIAFARLADVEPINLVLPRWKGDGSVDCILPDRPGGRECDVKYCRMNPPYLLEDEDAAHFSAIYVLVIGAFPTYRYRGWAAFCELIHACNVTHRFKHKPTYALGRFLINRDLVILAPALEAVP